MLSIVAPPPAVALPQEERLAHVARAHCSRIEAVTADGERYRSEVSCEWPADDGPRIVLSAACYGRVGSPAYGSEGSFAELRAAADGGPVAGVRAPLPFDTERDLVASHFDRCEGVEPRLRAVPLVGGLATGWVENASSRPGGCRWLTLAPLRSAVAGPGRDAPVRFDASLGATQPREGVPILLAECCTGPSPPPAPLAVLLDVDPFEGDPSALYVTDPRHWLPILARRATGRSLYHDAETPYRLADPDRSVVHEGVLRVRRDAETWSTVSAYQARLDPAHFASAFRGRRIRLDLAPAPADPLAAPPPVLHGWAEYHVGERTATFLDACAPEG